MFKILFFMFATLMSVYGQADRYPAGLNPALCPGYPNCDNSLLALYLNSGHGALSPISVGPSGEVAARYPADVPASACPNYPFCHDGLVGAAPALPLPGFAQRLYPDGVPPAACPNYPFCHS